MKKLVSHLALAGLLLTALQSSVRAEENKPASFINVKEAGAKGDGVADDTPFIQKAIDALAEEGGTIFFPEGRYRITKTLLTTGRHASTKEPWSYIEFKGAGKNSSWLLGDGVDYILGAAEVPNRKGDGRGIIHGMTVKDLAFASYDKSSRCGGIDASYMIRWSVSDCQFVGLNTGIYSNEREKMSEEHPDTLAVYIIRIHHNVFYGCDDYAIKLGRIFDTSIENNEIEHGHGGIQIGKPGDGFDAAANTIRIVNNLIEGLGPKHPAILGSCWIGAQVVGNYFEANMGGDIELTPQGADGFGRGITISANTFQPTKEQRESGNYGPILLKKTIDTVITGNFTTGQYLIHPESKYGKGVNITSNVLRNPPEIGDIHGAKAGSPEDYIGTEISVENAEKWGVSGPLSTVGLHSLFGFQYIPRNQPARYIKYADAPPAGDNVQHNTGDLIFNLNPLSKGGNQILLGWICVENGAPGVWKSLLVKTE